MVIGTQQVQVVSGRGSWWFLGSFNWYQGIVLCGLQDFIRNYDYCFWFVLFQPHIEAMQGDIDFDSEASDDSSLDDYYDDDEDEGAFGTRGSTLSSGKNQQDGCDQYSDPTSYSWCLLRYTTVRLVLQKLQTFLPSVGIELAGQCSRIIL